MNTKERIRLDHEVPNASIPDTLSLILFFLGYVVATEIRKSWPSILMAVTLGVAGAGFMFYGVSA